MLQLLLYEEYDGLRRGGGARYGIESHCSRNAALVKN